MSYLSTRFARALAARATSAAEVDALLPHCHLDRDPLPLATFPSHAVAARMLRGSVGEALTIAGHPDLPADLAAVAGRDSRKTVRRAVAANPSTPPPVLDHLAGWARSAPDIPALHALMAHAPLALAAALAEDVDWPDTTSVGLTLSSLRDFPAAGGFARNILTRRGERVSSLPAAVLFHFGLVGSAEPEQMTALMSSLPPGSVHATALAGGAWLAPDSPELPSVVADAVLEVLEVLRSSAESVPLWLRHALVTGRPHLRLDDFRRVVEVAPGSVLLTLADDLAPEPGTPARDDAQDRVRALASRANADVAARLLASPQLRSDMPDDVRLLLCGHLNGKHTDVAASILTDPSPLPPESLTHLLRCGSAEVTAQWLNGALPHPPQLPLFLDLVQTPGNALGSMFSSKSVADAIAALDRTSTGLADPLPRVLQPVSAALVLHAAKYADYDARASRAVDAIAAELCGSAEAQLLAVRLAGEPLDGTLEDFCRMVRAATAA